MRILITGAGGFVGRWAQEAFLHAGHEVIPTEVSPQHDELLPLDVTQSEQINNLLVSEQPDACLHLGGIAFVPMGWEKPAMVCEVNTLGTINLLEGFRKHAPEAAFLMVSSAEVYGREPHDHAIQEEDALSPSNIYAVSKAAADQTTLLYAKRYGMRTMTARPQNHIGPGQNENFVAASFARQVSNIAAGTAPNEMQVGNIDAQRDFLDVRDVVNGYRLLLEKGQAGHAYNLAAGKTIPIRTILDTLCELAGCHPEISIDPDRFREERVPPLLSPHKIRAHTGWEAAYDLRTTLQDILTSIRSS